MGTRSATAPYGAAQSVWTSFPPGSCGSGGGGTQLVLIKWNDSTWDPASQTQTTAVDSAAYYIRTVRTESQLHRVFCRDGAQVSDATLAECRHRRSQSSYLFDDLHERDTSGHRHLATRHQGSHGQGSAVHDEAYRPTEADMRSRRQPEATTGRRSY